MHCHEDSIFDALIIGGGFYGCTIAIYLAKSRGLKKIGLIESESCLMARASFNNQARVHNGYHYPRSFTTAYRSRVNFPRFVHDWPTAIVKNFTKVYAIARNNSKVTSRQFQRFFREIGAKLEHADPSLRQLFEPRLIEDVFLAEEYAFDARQLSAWALQELAQCGVQVFLESTARKIMAPKEGQLRVELASIQQIPAALCSRRVFNCTYSGLNQIGGDLTLTTNTLKQEITEMALVQTPASLSNLGITVMDGPFFSLMPFPAKGLHTLSHVRYTPHEYWQDQVGINPYQRLAEHQRESRANRMIRDAGRYLPAIFDARHVDSLYEVKTVLTRNEGDDGRPILFEKHTRLPGCFSILGGKIDNIYDVLEKLDAEDI